MKKKFILLVFFVVMSLCFSSCDTIKLPLNLLNVDSSEEQKTTETMQTIQVPERYCDDLWRSTFITGRPWLEDIADRTEPVGQEFEVKYTFMTEDENYLPENYEIQFAVSDPTVAEVLPHKSDSTVRLKGLKPGSIWLEMKMIHKETGGVYCTYVGLNIIPADKS